MFDINLQFGIKTVVVKTIEEEGRIFRRVRATLVHAFDSTIASALGPDAATLLRTLKSGGAEKVVMPIGRLRAHGALVAPRPTAEELAIDPGCADQHVLIKNMLGVRATGIAAKESQDDEEPTIQLEFEFPWARDAWVFLGEHCSAIVSCTLSRSQLEANFDDGTDESAPN